MTEQPLIGRFSSHGEFLAVLRAQAERMGLNYQMLDAAAGFGDGYSTKVLPDRPQKNFSPRSFDAYLGALGLEFIAVENPQKVARTKAFCKSKEMRPDGPRVVRAIARMPRPTWLFSSQRARIAAKKRWRTVSPKARRKAARKAAKARWRKPKITEIKPGATHGAGTLPAAAPPIQAPPSIHGALLPTKSSGITRGANKKESPQAARSEARTVRRR